MRLKLQNIGIVSSADINIDGITLITGENDSGKSTIGKVLYSIIRALNNNESNFNESKLNFIKKKVEDVYNLLSRAKNLNKNDASIVYKINEDKFTSLFSLYIEDDIDKITDALRVINGKLKNHSNISLKENILKILNEVEERESISLNSTQFLNFELSEYFNLEFGNHISNAFSKEKPFTEIKTNIETSLFLIKENKVLLEKKPLNFPYKDVIFIESPLFLKNKSQNLSFNLLRDKRNYLNQKTNQKAGSRDIFSDNSKNIKHLNNIIEEIIGGKFSYNDKNEIIFNKKGQSFSLDNVATGLKTFGAIQLLIDNGNLNIDTLLIIDEPEVHLHPTWQVKFAEILVRLSKEFAIPMVLTSHSPYFIEAIEAYSIKHKYEGSTDFYFAQKDKKGESSRIININNDLSKVLDSISEAYYTLQDIRDGL